MKSEKQNQKLTGYPSIDKPWLKYYDTRFITEPLPQMNIYSYLKEKTRGFEAYTAISYFGYEVSYKQLFEYIERVAKLLIYMGVKADDRIMFLMPNIPETMYLFYACARIGAISDFVDPRPDSIDLLISAKKIIEMVRDEKIQYLVVLDQCYLAMIQPVEKELLECDVKSVLLVSTDTSMTAESKRNYLNEKMQLDISFSVNVFSEKMKKTSELMEQAKSKTLLNLLNYKELIDRCNEEVLPEISYVPNNLAVIVHTSGTTSAKPKPIPLTHDNLNIYVHQTFGANMPMKVGDRQLHILPYFAAFGIVDVVHACLCHINNLIQIPEFSPEHLGQLIKIYSPQTIIGTPSWFLGLLKDASMEGADLSCLTMVTYGGDAMDMSDEENVNAFLKKHNARCKLTKGHGMSETCGCASYAIGEYNLPACIGIPMPLTTYALVNPDTKEMLKFEDEQKYLEGELIISSGAVTPGVLDDHVIVPHKDYYGSSFIFTRDIARMDRNGIMTFLARNDRSFTRFDGFKIKPYEIENVILQHPAIEHCIISPLYDKSRFGYLLVANIIINREIQTHEEMVMLVRNIIDDCFTHNPSVSTRQIPSRVILYDAFPLTKNGKIDLNALIINSENNIGINIILKETNIEVESITIQ